MNPIPTHLMRDIDSGKQHTINYYDIPHIPPEFDTIKYRVIKILQQFPETRNSDKLLLHRYYKFYEHIETNLHLVNTAMESVTRARRSVQEHNSDLAAAPEFQAARELLQDKYTEYYGMRKGHEDLILF